ncbi:MAG: hypothetical protein L0Y44_04355 [Phycisphaerales bacterium]|nr:hypothetical protein [Phycisphaerales bacterium]MCI0629870.1 hypothetical protein [Phycisphaerales bacterium]
MSRLTQSLKKAFAVDDAGPAEPTEAQQVVVDKVCREVVRRHMTTPALIFLEMSRPLNYVGAQMLHFFQPIASALMDTAGYEQFATFMERRGSLEYMCRRIEHFESECVARQESEKSPDKSK